MIQAIDDKLEIVPFTTDNEPLVDAIESFVEDSKPIIDDKKPIFVDGKPITDAIELIADAIERDVEDNESIAYDNISIADDDEPTADENESNDDEKLDLSDKFITDMVFETRQELVNWAKETGKEVGTIIVTKRSDFVTGRRPRLLLGCERAGKYRAPKPRSERKSERKKVGSKLCGCPFLLRGLFQAGSQDKWKVKVVCGRHNHPLVSNGIQSAKGRLTAEERKIVEDMSASGLRLKEALTVIKSRNPTNASTIRHVYNARSTIKKNEMREKTQMQQLMKELRDNAYRWSRRHEDPELVQDLFWAHPESVQLAKCFPRVFLMDSTYKTNRFKRKLFEIVGVTPTNQTFSVCFTLMEEEKEDNYVWALEKFRSLLDDNALPAVIVTNNELPLINGLRKVFPWTKLLLSRWHVSKDIMGKANKEISDSNTFTKFIDKWQELVVAPTEGEYDNCLKQLEEAFSEYRPLLDYVNETWLVPYKDRFVAAWIDLHMHVGNTSTNKAEGTHSRLKKQLQASNYDILGMWRILHPLLNLQFTDIKSSFETSMKETQHRHQINALKDVRGITSIFAMDIILEEKKRDGNIIGDSHSCRCVIRRTHGLPCVHELMKYQKVGCAIPLSSIDPMWRKLSAVIDAPNRGDLDTHREFHLFSEHFNESNDDRRVYLLNILKELASPEATHKIEGFDT